jgi:GNAT superfamily N-acetyltransferase
MPVKHNDISLCVVNEQDISVELDRSIRNTLVVCFPADRDYYSKQSWWYCIPIYRVLARDSKDVIVAHAAVVRRDVVVGESSLTVRVAGIQSFCILPNYRGTGLSDTMMSVVMQEAKRRSFNAGLLFCLPQLEPVYGRMGWSRLDAAVYMADDKENRKLIPAKNITMFYPLRIKQFPAGDIDLAGTDW